MINKLFLTFSSTYWFVIIYCISFFCKNIENLTTEYLSDNWIVALVITVGIILMLVVPILLKKGSNVSLSAKSLQFADGIFMPIYLAYFFISISLSNRFELLVMYILIMGFTLLSNTEYFNPLFLLMKYHIYNVISENDVQICLIYKSVKPIRSVAQLQNLNNLKRINNFTMIGKEI